MESKDAVAALAALAHDTRLALFRLLVRAGGGRHAASEIADELGTGLLVATMIGSGIMAETACWTVAGYWLTSSTSFANPAVTIARTMTDSFSGIRPMDAHAFIAMQIAGALLAMLLSRWLIEEPSP